LQGTAEHPGPTLTERELLGLVVDFANDGKLSRPLLDAPGLRFIPPYNAPADWLPTSADLTPDEQLRLATLREQLRLDLASALRKGFTPQDSRRIREAAKQMVALPVDYEAVSTRTRPRQRHIHTRWYYVPLSLEAILARAVLWLRDETLGLGADLKQCSLGSCGNFFFRSDKAKTRGRPRIYCSVEHMQQAHEATGPERTRRWRAKVAKHK